MQAESVKLVVCDMAGTTVRDDGLVLECFVEAANAVGLHATREELNDRMGTSKFVVFDELAKRQLGVGSSAETLRDAGYGAFRKILESAYEHGGVAAIAGAEEMFAWLHARGIQVALNTGFYRRVTEIIIEALRWKDVVDAVVCVDDVVEGRPAPYMVFEAMQRCRVRDVAEVVVVGDTPSDMIAGRRSGARTVVGVMSGAHTGATLRRYPSTHVIACVRGLPEVLERVGRLDRVARESGAIARRMAE